MESEFEEFGQALTDYHNRMRELDANVPTPSTLAPELVELRQEGIEIAKRLRTTRPDYEKWDAEKIDVLPYLEHMHKIFGPTSNTALASKIGNNTPLLYSTLRALWMDEKYDSFTKPRNKKK